MALQCTMVTNLLTYQAGGTPPQVTLAVYNPNAAAVSVTGVELQFKDKNADAERQSKEQIETTKLAESLVVHSSNSAQADRTHALAATDSAHQRIMDLHQAITTPPPQPPNPTGIP